MKYPQNHTDSKLKVTTANKLKYKNCCQDSQLAAGVSSLRRPWLLCGIWHARFSGTRSHILGMYYIYLHKEMHSGA